MNLTVTISQIIVILALGILGGFVLVKRPKDRTGQLFALLCFFACGWVASEMMTNPFEAARDGKTAHALRNLTKCFTSHLVATLVCFAWYFPQKSLKITNKHFVFVYLIALFFSIGAFTPWDATLQGFKPNGNLDLNYGPIHDLYFAYIIAGCVYALGHLFRKYRQTESPIARIQIQYFVIGLGLSVLIGIVFSLILPRLRFDSYFFVGTIGPLIGFLFTAYAIIKYRAMEIETFIHRSLIWLLMSSLVWLPVSVIILLIGDWIRSLNNLGLTLFATAMFFPIFAYIRKIQPLIDRLFQRDYYARRAAIDQLIEDARELKDLPALARQVCESTKQVLRVPHVTLLVYREHEERYVLIDGASEYQTLEHGDAFLRWLAEHNAILEKAQVRLQPQHAAIHDAALDYFQQMSAEVCVPFVDVERSGIQLIGVLNLGRKSERRWRFSVREIDLLTRLRAAITLALDNSLLHEAQLNLQETHVQAELIATASSTLAHSIKNPLGILGVNLDLVRDVLLPINDDDADFAISEIESQIRRIGQIVNQIRNADIGEPDKAPCELNIIVREALAEVKLANPQSSVQVEMLSAEIPEILGDTNQLRRAFVNLITNAYQAMQASGGRLTIQTEASTQTVRVEVRDTGGGMPEDFIRQILSRPFHTRKRSGTGLGVWTTKKIIEAHGGSLELTSREGVGTTAVVLLPRQD